MKRFLLSVLVLITSTTVTHAQQDTALSRRLQEILGYTQLSEIDKILDYTYPKIFTLATRDQMKEQLLAALDNEEFTTTLDSIRVKTIFPVFSSGKGRYAKISHTMIMRMKFKSAPDSTNEELFTQLMGMQFGKENIRFSRAEGVLHVNMLSYLVAIKDEFANEWSFVNYDEESSIVPMLFSKEVVEKLKAYH